jgi:hypothetical protein
MDWVFWLFLFFVGGEGLVYKSAMSISFLSGRGSSFLFCFVFCFCLSVCVSDERKHIIIM